MEQQRRFSTTLWLGNTARLWKKLQERNLKIWTSMTNHKHVAFSCAPSVRS